MPGLSAKVFRTYNASHTMEQELARLTPENGTVTEKLLAYNRANRAVAVLCNHQRAVGKGHAGSMEKLSDKVSSLSFFSNRVFPFRSKKPSLTRLASAFDRSSPSSIRG